MNKLNDAILNYLRNIIKKRKTQRGMCIIDLCRVFDSSGENETGRLEAVFFDKIYSHILIEDVQYFIPRCKISEKESVLIFQSDESGFVCNLHETVKSDVPTSQTHHREETILSGRYETREEAETETNKWDVCGQESYDVTWLEREKKHAIISSNRYPNLTKGSAFLRVKWKGGNGTEKKDTVFSAQIVQKFLSSREYINIREFTIDMLDVSE
jgi:hypothetical protein